MPTYLNFREQHAVSQHRLAKIGHPLPKPDVWSEVLFHHSTTTLGTDMHYSIYLCSSLCHSLCASLGIKYLVLEKRENIEFEALG